MQLPKYVKISDHPHTYILLQTIQYYSKRYNRTLSILAGTKSDGATGWVDLRKSLSWWVHDEATKDYACWDDGTPLNNTQASFIIHDILKEENRLCLARLEFTATLLYGKVVVLLGFRKIKK